MKEVRPKGYVCVRFYLEKKFLKAKSMDSDRNQISDCSGLGMTQGNCEGVKNDPFNVCAAGGYTTTHICGNRTVHSR